MVSRCLAILACLTILGDTGSAQEKQKSPDDQVKELIAKYHALPEKQQSGPEGAALIKQLKAMPGDLSPQAREAVARLETAHNLRQLALAIQQNQGKVGKPPAADAKPPADWASAILPYLDKDQVFPLRPRWEYKVLSEGELLKLGKDDLAAGLNKLGEDGWELQGFDRTRFILKRPKVLPAPAP
jgi:hypothetical protein